MSDSHESSILASRPIQGIGVGLRSQHFAFIREHRPAIAWFEALTDNYLNEGGPAKSYLQEICQHYPIALHGVGLSLGSTDALDNEYLKKLKNLITEFQPALISEHLSWISVQGQYTHQLLPLPYTEEAISHVVQRIESVQNFLGKQILIENVSSYLNYSQSVLSEWEFLNEIAERADCFILLDINNIFVSAANQNYSPLQYLTNIKASRVKQFHLAGYEQHENYLLDTHSTAVSTQVWNLYQTALEQFGLIPTLIEWDANIPEFPMLQQEVVKAEQVMKNTFSTAVNSTSP